MEDRKSKRAMGASAQLIAWSVIEKILNSMWADLHRTVDVGHGGHTKMTNARLRSLNGRDYSASVISQVLSISGKIDDDLLDRLDAARKKRIVLLTVLSTQTQTMLHPQIDWQLICCRKSQNSELRLN